MRIRVEISLFRSLPTTWKHLHHRDGRSIRANGVQFPEICIQNGDSGSGRSLWSVLKWQRMAAFERSARKFYEQKHLMHNFVHFVGRLHESTRGRQNVSDRMRLPSQHRIRVQFPSEA
jgi:hypothetical protein